MINATSAPANPTTMPTLIWMIPAADVPEALALGAALAVLAALIAPADELPEGVPLVPPKGTLSDEMLAIPSFDKATDTPLPLTQTELVSGAPAVKLTPAHSPLTPHK
jgi:hypothetical protein